MIRNRCLEITEGDIVRFNNRLYTVDNITDDGWVWLIDCETNKNLQGLETTYAERTTYVRVTQVVKVD